MRRLLLVLTVLLVFPAPAHASWTWPVRGDVITPYRNGSDPYAAGQHRGIDIRAAVGTPVAAAAAGEVRFAGTAGSSGLTVSVRTGDGFDSSYLHLSSLAVRAGEPVSVGERLGAVGTTGQRSATEPHLHFGVREAGSRHAYLDPLSLLPPLPPPSAPPAEAPRPTPEPTPAPGPLAPRPAPAPAPAPAPGRAPRPAPLPGRARRLAPTPGRAPRLAPTPGRAPRSAPVRGRAPRLAPTPDRSPGLAPTPGRASHSAPAPALGRAPRPASMPGLAPRPAPTANGGPRPAPTANGGQPLVSSPASDTARPSSGGPDIGWALACAGLLLAAGVLGFTDDGRRATARSRSRLASALRPLVGKR